MVDDHAVAVDAEEIGPDDPPGVGGENRHVGGSGQVEPEVNLLVDFTPVVDVGPVIREPRLHLRVAQLAKRLAPQPRVRGVRRERHDPLGVEPTEPAVDGQIPFQQTGVGRQRQRAECVAAGDDVRHHLFEETVADREA